MRTVYTRAAKSQSQAADSPRYLCRKELRRRRVGGELRLQWHLLNLLNEILEELPRLSHQERREVCRRLIDLEPENAEITLCDHAAREGFEKLDHLEAEERSVAVTSNCVLNDHGVNNRVLDHGKDKFDEYLEQQLRDPDFADLFEQAGAAWDVALQIAALREQAGLSQKELADRLGTSQQQISRLESPSYERHSLSMRRRVAGDLHARLRVVFEPKPESSYVAEESPTYGQRRAGLEFRAAAQGRQR